MVTEWPLWWCCLRPGWRDMFNWMGDLAPIPDVAVLRATYDAQFEANIAPKESWLYDYFNTSFNVHFAEVDVPPIGVVEAAVWELTTWLQFNLFRDTDEYACTDPCPYTSPPFNLPG